MKIAIIGLGIVGAAQAKLFAQHEQVTYDPKHDKIYPEDRIAQCDYAVVCVGTPPWPDGSANINEVERAIEKLPSHIPVILRSTVPPGTTHHLQAQPPWRMIAHVPEFLHERAGGSWANSSDVPFVLLGVQEKYDGMFFPLLREVYPDSYIHICRPEEAEMAKYALNLYWATRVTFINEMAQIAAKAGISWEPVRQAMLSDKRIGPAYTSMEGFPPGFGGRCWPKDLSALIAFAKDHDYQAEFLKDIEAANERFRECSPGTS